MRIGDYKYRFIDQPSGWLGGTVKVDWPITGEPAPRSVRADRAVTGSLAATINWFKYQFWRFVFVQQEVAKFARPSSSFRRMQKAATFNLDAVKEQVLKAMQRTTAPEQLTSAFGPPGRTV